MVREYPNNNPVIIIAEDVLEYIVKGDVKKSLII
jgi:hypothetical protein